MTKLAVTKVTVKAVRINADEVQSVRFLRNHDRHVFSARTRGHTPIRIRFDAEQHTFHAGNRSGTETAKTADKAFAKAVKTLWSN